MRIEVLIFGILVIIALVFLYVGMFTINQCTPLNQWLGNCANPTMWFVSSIIVGGLALVFGMVALLHVLIER